MSTAAAMAARIGYRLKLAQVALRSAMEEALSAVGVTAPQYAVLTALELDPGRSSAALARAAFVTPQTMQGIVANLERAGLLSRAPDPSHGRIKRATLTAAGRATLKRAHALVAEVEARMLAGFSPRDLDTLGAALARAADNLRCARPA
jgi:DNA-binding MarR family transcriptional regulator